MTIKVHTTSGVSGINSIRVRGATATKRATRIKFRTGLGAGDLDQVFTGVDPLSISFGNGDFTSFNNTTVTGSITASVAGGLSPLTYSWSVLSFSAGVTPTLSFAATASPTVRQTGVPPEGFENATLQVVVTDSLGQTATSSTLVSFNNVSFS